MKRNTVTETIERVVHKPCIVCGRLVTAFYGLWGFHGEGTCSRKCEETREKQTRMIFDGRP